MDRATRPLYLPGADPLRRFEPWIRADHNVLLTKYCKSQGAFSRYFSQLRFKRF